MSVNSISHNVPHTPPLPSEEVSQEDATTFAKLSAEEAHKRLVDTNKKYIFDQMIASNRHFTQEMIRAAKEQQNEE